MLITAKYGEQYRLLFLVLREDVAYQERKSALVYHFVLLKQSNYFKHYGELLYRHWVCLR
jgi:hypothetical protein